MAFLTTGEYFPGSINCYHKVSDGTLKCTVVYSTSGYKFHGEYELNILYAFSKFWVRVSWITEKQKSMFSMWDKRLTVCSLHCYLWFFTMLSHSPVFIRHFWVDSMHENSKIHFRVWPSQSSKMTNNRHSNFAYHFSDFSQYLSYTPYGSVRFFMSVLNHIWPGLTFRDFGLVWWVL